MKSMKLRIIPLFFNQQRSVGIFISLFCYSKMFSTINYAFSAGLATSGDYLNINSVNFKKINYLLLSLAVKEEVGGGSLLQLGNGQPLVGLPPADLS